MNFVNQAWTILVALCLLYAASCDIAVRLIPNRLCLSIVVLALPFRLLDHELIQSIAVAALIFMVLTGLWLLRLLGGGDVKFWAACSLLIPPRATVQSLFSLRVILVGGAVALLYLLLRLLVRWRAPVVRARSSDHRLVRVWRAEQWRARRNGSIPYGVAIALSAWLTFIPTVHP